MKLEVKLGTSIITKQGQWEEAKGVYVNVFYILILRTVFMLNGLKIFNWHVSDSKGTLVLHIWLI